MTPATTFIVGSRQATRQATNTEPVYYPQQEQTTGWRYSSSSLLPSPYSDSTEPAQSGDSTEYPALIIPTENNT